MAFQVLSVICRVKAVGGKVREEMAEVGSHLGFCHLGTSQEKSHEMKVSA